MTAPDEHVTAVARVLSLVEGVTPGTDPIHDFASTAILDSTDPAVHAALVDALTRHGANTERRTLCASCGEIRGECENLDDLCAEAGWVEHCRLVTGWHPICGPSSTRPRRGRTDERDGRW
mgnify:CR=1 FL=1